MAEWPLRINISEEEVWAPYDTARASKNKRGDVMDWATDNAWEDWSHIGRECLDILRDLVEAYIPKAKAKKISEYDIRRICEAIKEDDTPFEEIRMAFVDAATWAWEEAYTPEDRDLEKALDMAIDDVVGDASLPDYFRLLFSNKPKGPKDWSPLKRYSEDDFYDELRRGTSFQHDPGQWDRFVVFDVMDGPAMKYFRRMVQSPLIDEDGEVVPYSPEEFERDIKDQFVDPVIHKLDGALQQVMDRVEPWQRVDFREHWKEVLRDKSRAKGISKEILDWLANNRDEGVSDES